MTAQIDFNEEKNQLLKVIRGVCFDDVIEALHAGRLLANISHPNKTYAHQKIFAVRINDYVYAVPYVWSDNKKYIFLKTVFPSRVLTKKYLRGSKP